MAFQKGEWKDLKKHCQAALQINPLSLDAQLLKVEADFRLGCFRMVAAHVRDDHDAPVRVFLRRQVRMMAGSCPHE